MRIYKIDNKTAFQGNFEYSEDLEKLMQDSNDKTLKRFDNLITQMQTIDDSWEYSVRIKEEPSKKSAKFEKTVTLISNKPGRIGFKDIDTVYRGLMDPYDKNCFRHTLDKIIDFVENEYYQAKIDLPKNNLIKSIIQKLK